MPGSRWLALLAAMLLASPANSARAEGFLATRIPYTIKGDQLTLATKVGIVLVPLPKGLKVFVNQRIATSDALPGDTIAVAGVKAKGAGAPTLEDAEMFLVHEPMPDAARKALALRFLPPQPRADPFNVGFATWSGIVSRPVEGGIEFKRPDGVLAVARPNQDNFVGQLRPGTRADLMSGRLRLFGAGERVTTITVDVPRPSTAQTLHLATPQVVDGVEFPAGSTLVMNEQGKLDKGTVPVPTRIADLMLAGDFETTSDGVEGVLAGPAEIEGVPCAAGHVRRDTDWGHGWPSHVECTLARDATVNGHDLTAGTEVKVSARSSGERRIDTGTLARAELLFDVTWPAGTILHGTSAPAERLAHAAASPGEEVSFCPPDGQEVPAPGLVLHGKIGYEVREDGRSLAYCDEHDRPVGQDGYATAGANRHLRGSQANTSSPWKWDDYRSYP